MSEPVIMTCGTPERANPKEIATKSCPKCFESICPSCGQHCSHGYGLAYGGIGAYTACNDANCGWFFKMQDEE